MAETFINVTEGSGKKLHTFDRTIGANSVHDEVVLLGEPYLTTYSVTTQSSGTSAATGLSHLLQVMAGASLNVYIRRIRVTQLAAATTAAQVALVVTRLTTAGTGGTVVTPVAYDGNDSAAGATAMTLPTVKGTNGGTLWTEASYWYQTAPTSVSGLGVLLDIDFSRPRSKSLRISAGVANGIAIQLQTAVAAATVIVAVEFSEANF